MFGRCRRTATITGRLNEDTYSVQLIDAQEELFSLVKEELREYELIKKSTMPLRKEVDPRTTGRPGQYLASLRRYEEDSVVVVWLSCWMPLGSQVTYDRLLRRQGAAELVDVHAGAGARASVLQPADQIARGMLRWRPRVEGIYQSDATDKFEASPLVVVMVSGCISRSRRAEVVAVMGRPAAGSGHTATRWRATSACCGRVNRGLAILGETLFLAALDAEPGCPMRLRNWKTSVWIARHTLTMALLVVKAMAGHYRAGGRVRYALLAASMRTPAGRYGDFTPFQDRGNRDMRRGQAMPGSVAAALYG